MLVQLIFLMLGTVCIILFLVSMWKGDQYIGYVEGLDSALYPFKDFYVTGFFLNSVSVFKLRGRLEQELKKQSKLIWDNVYYEYYAILTWAQFLTIALISCCIGFMLCGLTKGTAAFLFFGILVLAIMAEWNLIISKMKESIQKRKEGCEMEFSNMILKLSLLINSGMILREAWELVANGKDGDLYNLMKKACDYMRNGDSDAVAINRFGRLSDSPEIMKFSSMMVQGIEKGNSELAEFLTAQASEQLAHKRQLALQEGEKAAGKLIIPLGITFAGIILIIVSAAMQSLSF